MDDTTKVTVALGEADDSRHEPPPAKETTRGKRARVTISLSEKSVKAFQEIRAATDADSDSEVFRNALRLYLSLLRAHQEGRQLCLRNTDGSVESVDLFLSMG